MKQEHRTKVNDRVRIKDSVTHMYPKARVYNEAIVRGRKHDEFGYPVIFVAWDQNHWAYSGEEDRWVMEAHFDLVEDSMADKKNEDFIKGLAELFERWKDDGPLDEDEADQTDPRPTQDPTYDEVLKAAMKDAGTGDAFIVLVARPEEFNGVNLVVPHVYMHSKLDDAAMMLEATMADYAAQSHARLVIQLVEQTKRKERKDDGSPSS